VAIMNGRNTVWFVENQPTLRGTCHPRLQGRRRACRAYSTLKMEATCSTETSVGFLQDIVRRVPEDRTVLNKRC
jgi:hypothetical protein